MKVYCLFSLESPHRGDSKEKTKNNIFSIKKKITLNYPKYAATGFFPKGVKKEFETAVVNEPSVFEPLKFYSIFIFKYKYTSSEEFQIVLTCSMQIRLFDNNQKFKTNVQMLFCSSTPWSKMWLTILPGT